MQSGHESFFIGLLVFATHDDVTGAIKSYLVHAAIIRVEDVGQSSLERETSHPLYGAPQLVIEYNMGSVHSPVTAKNARLERCGVRVVPQV